MKKQGSGWKGESRRHSLAKKGVKTVLPDGRTFDKSQFIAKGEKDEYYDSLLGMSENWSYLAREDYDKIIDYINGLDKWTYGDFISNKRRQVASLLNNKIWKETGNYPNKEEQKLTSKFAFELDIPELLYYGMIPVYQIETGEKYNLTFGSNTRNPSGTHTKWLKSGDLMVFDSSSPDNTHWFIFEGERGKHEYGAFGGIENSEKVIRLI